MTPALAIHGGAWNIPDEQVEATLLGLRAALRASWQALDSGASAVDVVEFAVRQLEDDPTFNAGTGSHLNRAGEVEMDAAIMDGSSLAAGAVAALQGFGNPVSVARRVMDASPHVLLVGAGAAAFARDQGIPACATADLLVGRARELYFRILAGETWLIETEFHEDPEARHLGTVGAVARDAQGRLAAATSTGGTLGKVPGRVGDSPLIGVGTYADSHGAVSCTGHGEAIMRVVLAKSAVDRLHGGLGAEPAAAVALEQLRRIGGHAGLLLLGSTGGPAACFNTSRMARGVACRGAGLRVGVAGELAAVRP